MINYLALALILFVISGVIIVLKHNRLNEKVYLTINTLASVLLTIPAIQVFLSGHNQLFYISLNKPYEMVNLLIDPLSGFFIFLIALMSIVVSFYSLGYLKSYYQAGREIKSHLFIINLFIISMVLVVLAQNALFFLIVWELMSITSFLLLSFENEKKEVQSAGLSYFIWMHVGVLFLIFAFIYASIISKHSLDFNAFRAYMPQSPQLNLIFILFFIGFGIKAGFVPFHSWLIKAHPAAPANISGIMSALMLKIGIYGILRMLEITRINSFGVALFVVIISIVSALWGIMYAVMQKDIKKILAYSSIENIGIIGLGIGISMLGKYYEMPAVQILGLGGALFHILNHSIYKSSLFFVSGNVYQALHEKDIDKLGGLAKYMKYSSAFALISCLAICALPPFNGFISEFLIFLSMFKGISGQNPEYSLIFIIAIISLAFVGVIALIAFTRFYAFTFLGNPRREHLHEYEKKPDNKTYPLFILLFVLIMVIIFSAQISSIMFKISGSVFKLDTFLISPQYSQLIKVISTYSLTFILLLAVLFFVKSLLNKKHKKVAFKTWDCGFQAGTNKMQYTGSSYSVDFYNLIQVFVRKKSFSEDLQSLFPKDHSSKSQYIDLFDTMFRKKYRQALVEFVNKLSRIQSGNTQSYLMYGVIFLLILIIYVTFIG